MGPPSEALLLRDADVRVPVRVDRNDLPPRNYTVAGVSQLPLTGSGPLQPYGWNEETACAWESVTADERSVTPGSFDGRRAARGGAGVRSVRRRRRSRAGPWRRCG
ncbi:MAG TPA: hypothetical protein VLL48_04580 [Longimicrobiales bacterium]|nr:hypothetical protein [Longimicrobiales bacterium]